MPFDRVHQLAVLAILAPHVDRNDGVQGRNHEKGGGPRRKQATIRMTLKMAENGWPFSRRASGGMKTASR